MCWIATGALSSRLRVNREGRIIEVLAAIYPLKDLGRCRASVEGPLPPPEEVSLPDVPPVNPTKVCQALRQPDSHSDRSPIPIADGEAKKDTLDPATYGTILLIPSHKFFPRKLSQ
jgi:hypothetical protein